MSDPADAKKPVGADLILPVCACAYAAYYVYSVRDFPFEAQISGMLLAGILGLFSAIYFIRVGIGLARGRYGLGFGNFFGPPETIAGRAGFVLLIVAYIFVVPWLGFVLTTFSFLSLSFLILGVRPIGKGLLVAAAAALAGWLFFIVILGTRFPKGPFEWAMSGLF